MSSEEYDTYWPMVVDSVYKKLGGNLKQKRTIYFVLLSFLSLTPKEYVDRTSTVSQSKKNAYK